MNEGRIEQVDDPWRLYNRPKTRFVAGFIGRTNFLEGMHEAGEIGFSGFAVKAGLFPDAGQCGRRVLFSVRPQTIRLARERGGNGGWWLAGRVVKRAYLGEYWDYVVAPGANGGAATLRVAAPPQDVFEDDEAVWLEIDPERVAYIPEGT
jgi:ABC-type Fe3+/spermidine/putrescine transport system ATPase subunit